MPGRNLPRGYRLSEGEVVSVPALNDTIPLGSQHTQPTLAQLLEVCVPTFGPKPAVLNPSYPLETSWMTGIGVCSPCPLPVLHGQCYALQNESGAILSPFFKAK